MWLCGPGDGDAESRRHSVSNDVTTIQAVYSRCESEVRLEGDIRFTADFTGIEHLSRGALLRIEVDRNGTRQRVEARPGSGGAPEFRWDFEGTDADRAAWLEAALLDVFRSTDIAAEERTAWILDQRGLDGLLSEVDLMWSNNARSAYLGAALENRDWNPSEVRRVFESARSGIDSDHSLAGVLLVAARHQTFDAATLDAFIDAAAAIESDHQHAQVLATALDRDDLSPDNLGLLLRTASAGIESDHQMAQILIELAQRYPLEPDLRGPFLQAAATLESDHQAGQVYGVVLAQPDLAPADLAEVLDAATSIESDHQLSEVLREVADQHALQGNLTRAWLDAAASIESDHQLGQSLRAFVNPERTADQVAAAIDLAARHIESDHELSTFLVHAGRTVDLNGAVRDAYIEALEGIESDHQRSQARQALRR